MALVQRWYVPGSITQLVTNSGHAYTVSSSTCDIPAADALTGCTFVGQAQFLTWVGATSDRPVMTVNGLSFPVSDMYDSTLAKQIHLKAGSNPAVWLDQVGASV
jgi:hypothetical protein